MLFSYRYTNYVVKNLPYAARFMANVAKNILNVGITNEDGIKIEYRISGDTRKLTYEVIQQLEKTLLKQIPANVEITRSFSNEFNGVTYTTEKLAGQSPPIIDDDS